MSATKGVTPSKELLEEQRKEIEPALDATIEETIRAAALPNTIAWVATVVGAFVINLLLLILVTGG